MAKNESTTTRKAEAILKEAAKIRRAVDLQGDQADTIRGARDTLDITSEELAELLGVSPATLSNWLVPGARHRDMPTTAKLLLARILADSRKRK